MMWDVSSAVLTTRDLITTSDSYLHSYSFKGSYIYIQYNDTRHWSISHDGVAIGILWFILLLVQSCLKIWKLSRFIPQIILFIQYNLTTIHGYDNMTYKVQCFPWTSTCLSIGQSCSLINLRNISFYQFHFTG